MNKLLAPLLSLLLLLPAPLLAAIAYEGTPTLSTATANALTQTTAVTVAGGLSNSLMAVCVHVSDSTAVRFATGVTYNGSAFQPQTEGNATTNAFVSQIFYLLAPASGTHDVVVTYSAADADAEGYSVHVFSGVDQGSPIDATANDNADTDTTPEVVITTVAANAWVLDCMTTLDGGTAVTQGAGQTEKEDRTSARGRFSASVVEGKASPGAETMDWTTTGGETIIAAASFKPAAAGGSTCNGSLMLMGVGGC